MTFAAGTNCETRYLEAHHVECKLERRGAPSPPSHRMQQRSLARPGDE
jgi:hypothetical protein